MTMYIDELGEERTEFRRLAHIEDGEIVAAVDDRFEEMLTDEMLTSYEALQERLDGTQYFALHYDESDIEEKEEKYTYPRTPAEDAQPEVKAAVERYREEVDEEEKEYEPLVYWLLGSGTPPYKMEKADADYAIEPFENQKCGNCEFYYEGVDGRGVCSQIRGEIKREHWCRLWVGVPEESGQEMEE
jgi:hypothetical protein